MMLCVWGGGYSEYTEIEIAQCTGGNQSKYYSEQCTLLNIPESTLDSPHKQS